MLNIIIKIIIILKDYVLGLSKEGQQVKISKYCQIKGHCRMISHHNHFYRKVITDSSVFNSFSCCYLYRK